MQKITPNLWFDHKVKEATDFYVSVFADSKITGGMNYPKSKEEGLADFQLDLAGQPLTVEFMLGDMEFVAINAGSEFKATPANSFMVNFDPKYIDNAREKLNEVWKKLTDGGKVVMPLDKYDFCEHYGWVEDKYGFSWQLMFTDPSGEDRPFIIPALMFGQKQQNKAVQAMKYYMSVFKNSRAGIAAPYGKATGPATAGSLMFADFTLENQWFVVSDSGVEQDFTFTEAVSYSVVCRDQNEIDYFWDKLSAHPDAEQCGWCKDKFGVSWQIVPENMDHTLMQKPGAYQTMMGQKKIIIKDY